MRVAPLDFIPKRSSPNLLACSGSAPPSSSVLVNSPVVLVFNCTIFFWPQIATFQSYFGNGLGANISICIGCTLTFHMRLNILLQESFFPSAKSSSRLLVLKPVPNEIPRPLPRLFSVLLLHPTTAPSVDLAKNYDIEINQNKPYRSDKISHNIYLIPSSSLPKELCFQIFLF